MITRNLKTKIKTDYLAKIPDYLIIKKYKITSTKFDKLINTPGFRKKMVNGVKQKRCKCCELRKNEEEYRIKSYNNGRGVRDNKCNKCNKIVSYNYNIINKKKIREYYKKYWRNYYNENKVRIREQRKIGNMSEEKQKIVRKKRKLRAKNKRKNKMILKINKLRKINEN